MFFKGVLQMSDKQTDDKQIILAQWQTCVEMANNTSQRRDTTNNFFMTLNSAILAAIFSISSVENSSKFFMLILGIFVSLLWFFLIRNFRLLNKVKFDIIMDIEEKLPTKPFRDEYEELKRLKNSTEKYKNFTKIESNLPLVFCGLYLMYILYLFCFD